MAIKVRNVGKGSYQLFYSSAGFVVGLTVVGYIIYPNLTKSATLNFDELGDGIYAITIPYDRQTLEFDEKYGVVVKENGMTKYFDIIRIIN